MAIVAPTVLEAVRYTGGWLFDRAMAGWEVTVAVSAPGDPTPIRILGARLVELEPALVAPPPRGSTVWPREIAVAGTIYENDHRIRDGILANLDDHSCEVMLWGGCPDELDCRTGYVEHRLSVAARAFKARALAAARVDTDQIPAIESFHRGGPLDHLTKDLVEVG